jgi:ketosteroid isomerase-like protein
MLIELLIVFAAAGGSNDELRQQVICAEMAFSRTAERRDLDAFLEFVDPDARFGTLRMARGHEEIARDWANVFEEDGPRMRWRSQIVEVSADGNLAISRGPFRSLRRGEDGQQLESWGHFISTWRRGVDGKWRVLFDTGADFGMQPSDEQIDILESDPDCPRDD